MCGIVGAFHTGGALLSSEALDRMIEAVAHRGPDGRGRVVLTVGGAQIGLGHARLKVIDLSDAAAQPMANDDRTVWVTFNGEIYNFQALRSQLTAQGIAFRSASDTEVILRLYEQHGERCLRSLDGMFALAIWDARARRLLLARDRVGKKPLFWAMSKGGAMVWASEMKALFRYPAVTPEIRREALAPLFALGYVPGAETIYQGVHKIPPGHYLTVEASGQTRLARYWDLAAVEPAGPAVSEGEATEMIRSLVIAAVQRRLVADVPLGAFLSGGLDSSIVVGIMSRLLREPVRTFTIGFAGDPRFDETRYARLVSQRFRTQHTEFVVEPSATLETVERLVWHHDGPFGDSSAVPTYLLAQMTRAHVTVALNGDGGDEIFAGYLRFAAALISAKVPAWLRQPMHAALSRAPAWGGPRAPWRRLQKFSAGLAPTCAGRLAQWSGIFTDDVGQLLGSGTDTDAVLAPFEAMARRVHHGSPLQQLLYVNLETYLADDLLVKMDRCTMAHGLEARSPFLDAALLEYAWGLPDRLKLRGLQTKVILRRAFRDLVPPEVVTRTKMGFGVPLQRWFAGALAPQLSELLLGPEARLRAYVNQDYVRQLCQAHWSGQADHGHRLWTLLTFEIWLRQLPSWRTAAVEPPGLPVVGGAHGASA